MAVQGSRSRHRPHHDPILIVPLLLSVAATVLIGQTEGKMSVRIVNQLPDTLSLHCKSADNDLGQQYIAPGQQYFFDFELNFWGTTDFWCFFNWGAKWGHFDVWTGPGMWGEGAWPCKQCLWEVQPGGFYRAQDGAGGGQPQLIYPWHWPPTNLSGTNVTTTNIGDIHVTMTP